MSVNIRQKVLWNVTPGGNSWVVKNLAFIVVNKPALNCWQEGHTHKDCKSKSNPEVVAAVFQRR
jgi:hypothetical protein